MRAVLAQMKASWIQAKSYRVSMILSILALTFQIAPVYFVARALQPLMEDSIRSQGHEYFGFVLVGIIVFSLIGTALTALPGAISGGIGSGFFEALLATPTSVPSLVTGQVGYTFVWGAVRSLLLLTAGWLLGANVNWVQLPEAILIIALILFSYFSIGLISGALVLSFKAAGPIAQGMIVVSALFGGVYYPTQVIPDSIQPISYLVPLTYGLRALRRVLLEGWSLSAIAGDFAALVAFATVLGGAGCFSFYMALRYARRAGSLAQY